jgi:hypothetical protein
MSSIGRPLLVLSTALLVFVAAVGTSGYGSASVDRSFDIDVVDDQDALFGVQAVETSGVVGGPTFLLAVPVDNTGGSLTIRSATVSGPVSVVEAGPTGVAVACTAATAGSEHVTLRMVVDVGNVWITTFTDITLTCTDPASVSPPTVSDGAGNVEDFEDSNEADENGGTDALGEAIEDDGNGDDEISRGD